MCKTYMVLNLTKATYRSDTGKLVNMTNGTAYSASYYDTLAGAQAQADAIARAGNLGIIFESKEFRQIQPAPVVIEGVKCCDPK